MSNLVRPFSAAIQQLTSNKQCDDSAESNWATLRDSLLEATDETCERTKGPARHSQTWWWNDEIDQCSPRQVVVEVRRALLTICTATLIEEKKTVRKSSRLVAGKFSFTLLSSFWFLLFGFILFLCLSNFTNTVFVEFLTNKHFLTSGPTFILFPIIILVSVCIDWFSMAVLLCCSLISLLFWMEIRSWTALRSTKYSFW